MSFDTAAVGTSGLDPYVRRLADVDGSSEGSRAVFPGADHGLYVADPDPAVPRTEQLAPGFLPMLGAFLASVGGRGPAD